MVKIRVVSASLGNRSCLLEVDASATVEEIMILVEVEFTVPMDQQQLFYKGRRLMPTESLQAVGLTRDGLEVQLGAPAVTSGGPVAPAVRPEDAIRNLFAQSSGQPGQPPRRSADEMIAQLFQQPVPSQPQLDPMDPEVQRRIYEEIQHQNLAENISNAIEYTPEAFATVSMLYVPAAVNGFTMPAFVDSGAQMTIMSQDLAEKCNLMRLVDRRFTGTARGVGETKIIGKVHLALVTLGGAVLPMGITVLEKVDLGFIIGLDQLRRHQMVIDLKSNNLKFQEVSVPFLAEHELPAHLRRANDGQEVPPSTTPAAAVSPHPTQQRTTPPPAQQPKAPPAPPKREREAPSATPPASIQPPDADARIERLMQLSLKSMPVVRQALEASNWDEGVAASLLFE